MRGLLKEHGLMGWLTWEMQLLIEPANEVVHSSSAVKVQVCFNLVTPLSALATETLK